MAQKIIYWLLLTLVFSLGFGQLLRFEYQSITIYAHDAVVALLLLLLLNARTLYRVVVPQSLQVFVIGLALSWLYALTQYQISDLAVPMLYTIRLLAYLSLYLVIKIRSIHIPYSTFLLSGTITLAVGLLQYFVLPDMRWAQYLGWDDHLSRLTLPHYDPTFTAVMLGLLLSTIAPIRRSIFDIVVPIFSLVAILLTYSRSVWLSLAMTVLLTIKNKMFGLIIVTCFLIISVNFLPKNFGEGNNLLRTYSITSRWVADIDYIGRYGWDLLIGRGLNTLILDVGESDQPNHATGPNNSYLYILTTTGVIGLLGWLMFMRDMYTKSAFKPMLLFFFISSLFNNVMFYSFALLWVLIADATIDY